MFNIFIFNGCVQINDKYDDYGRLVKTIYSDASYEELTPDDTDRTTAILTWGGQTINLGYDDLDRIDIAYDSRIGHGYVHIRLGRAGVGCNRPKWDYCPCLRYSGTAVECLLPRQPGGVLRIRRRLEPDEIDLSGQHLYHLHVNPPEPHAHDIETKNKIGVETGNVYDTKGRRVIGRLKRKHLQSLRAKLRAAGLIGAGLAAIEILGSISADEAQAFENILNTISGFRPETQEKILMEIMKNRPDLFKEIKDFLKCPNK